MSDRIQSEAELIATYLAPLCDGAAGTFGLKDDCATLAVPPGEELVMTMDAVAAGVHFFADDAPHDIAWKALAVNMSDLAAKGACPVTYLMSLAFPEAPERAWMERFAAGLREAQTAFGLHLAGGDTDRRPGPLSITITALGSVLEGRMVRRGTARPGDDIYVSGTIGDAALGLMLRRTPGLSGTWGLAEGDRQHLVTRYLRPEPRLGLRAALQDFASAAMDVSDGLAKDLGRMCEASGVSAVVATADVPMSAAASQAMASDASLLEAVLAGGDDFELLVAVAPDRAGDFARTARLVGVEVARIGRMGTGAGVVLLDQQGRPVALGRAGWDHF